MADELHAVHIHSPSHVTVVHQQHNVTAADINSLNINDGNDLHVDGKKENSDLLSKLKRWESKGKLYELLSRKQYRETLVLVNDLLSRTQNKDERTEFLLLSFVAHCHTKRAVEAHGILMELCVVFTNSSISPLILKQIAGIKAENTEYYKALCFYYFAAKSARDKPVGPMNEFIKECVLGLVHVFGRIKRENKFICRNLLLPTINDVICDIKVEMTGDTLCFINLAWMYHNLALCYDYYKMQKDAIVAQRKIINLLETKLGKSDAATRKIYAFTWHNLAASYSGHKNYEAALDAYEKAHEMNLLVTDWSNEKEKDTCIELTQKNYGIVKIRMKR